MTITYSISPNETVQQDGAPGEITSVDFTVDRSGDTNSASSVNWELIDDPNIDPSIERQFLANDAAASGTLDFAAGETEQTISLPLVGGIDVLPQNLDWGTFDVGVKLDAPTQSGSGFSESASGGYGVTIDDYTVTAGGGSLELDYQMYTIPDQADVYKDGVLIMSTGSPVSDDGILTYQSGAAGDLEAGDDIKVVITGAIQGTAWDYTLKYVPGISAVTEGHTTLDTGAPSNVELARLSQDVYGDTANSLHGYKRLAAASVDPGFAGFDAAAYSNENGSQIVIAFRGTVTDGSLATLKNALSDTSFFTGVVTPTLLREVTDAVAFVNEIEMQYGGSADITLTGHSLGGGLAQIVGQAGDFKTVAFNAPGSSALLSQLSSNLAGLSYNGGSSSDTNYRMLGDQVSLAGAAIGDQETVDSPNEDSLADAGANHAIALMVDQLGDDAPITDGVPDSTSDFLPALENAIQPALVLTETGLSILGFTFAADALVDTLLDPGIATNYVVRDTAGSPFANDVVLPGESGVADYRLQTLTDGVWSDAFLATPGTKYTFAADTTGYKFVPLDALGNAVEMPSSFYFQSGYTTSGQVNASMRAENGDRTSAHDFTGDGAGDMIWQFNDGSTYEWVMQDGQHTSNVSLGSLANYQVIGTGDFNGDGTTDVLWQNTTTGATYGWTMTNGSHTGDQSFGNLSGWTATVGDFNGDGTSDIVWQSAATGEVYEWTMNGGQHVGDTDLGNLAGWKEVGRGGDFNGDGASDLVWQSGSGDIYEWGMTGGNRTSSTYLGNLNGWDEVGTGDFNGDGVSDMLWKSASNGDTWEWTFDNAGNHTGNDYIGNLSGWNVEGTGDYNRDGTSDIVWQNQASGATYEWTMVNGTKTGDTFLGALAGWQGK